ncbi:hypothetical protein QFC21_004196 [Naganishia friedmannii]|uniref:Uncharacterized protein n=1 Tax=Naganishia friedmannii TaxID=89922 RepID=A0ACC2VKA5_9TREE|nr:hypothetical protein QFC21_004196 [Naganishia friedmannii]
MTSGDTTLGEILPHLLNKRNHMRVSYDSGRKPKGSKNLVQSDPRIPERVTFYVDVPSKKPAKQEHDSPIEGFVCARIRLGRKRISGEGLEKSSLGLYVIEVEPDTGVGVISGEAPLGTDELDEEGNRDVLDELVAEEQGVEDGSGSEIEPKQRVEHFIRANSDIFPREELLSLLRKGSEFSLESLNRANNGLSSIDEAKARLCVELNGLLDVVSELSSEYGSQDNTQSTAPGTTSSQQKV